VRVGVAGSLGKSAGVRPSGFMPVFGSGVFEGLPGEWTPRRCGVMCVSITA